MKRSLFIFLGILLALTSSASAECLMTFNTYGPMYASQVAARSVRIVEDIKNNHSCELIHFQEAWSENQIGIFLNGLQSRYQIYSPNRQQRIGLMSFSKSAWASVKTYTYRANFDGHFLDDVREIVNAKKAFSVVTESLAGAASINTHLHPTSDQVRILQILDLLNWRVQNQAQLMIVSGDFNMDPSSLEHFFLRHILNVEDAMLTTRGQYPSDFCTYCANNPLGWLSDDHTFDYVFFSRLASGQKGWVPQNVNLVLTGGRNPLSDHYGLKVNFTQGQGSAREIHVEESRKKMLDLFDAVILKVLDFPPARQLNYISLLQRIRSEVQNGQGPYGKYFQNIFQQY